MLRVGCINSQTQAMVLLLVRSVYTYKELRGGGGGGLPVIYTYFFQGPTCKGLVYPYMDL